jgi:hypothetical protein
MATRKPSSRTSAKTVAKAASAKSAPAKTTKPGVAAAPAKRSVAKPVAEAVNGAAAAQPAKPKHKLVRDSFTIPKSEYAVLGELKQRAAGLARPVKKSELLRAGISALSRMGDKAFLTALDAVPSLKTGRPKDSSASTDKGSAEPA